MTYEYFFIPTTTDSLTTRPVEKGKRRLRQFATCKVLLMRCRTQVKNREENLVETRNPCRRELVELSLTVHNTINSQLTISHRSPLRSTPGRTGPTDGNYKMISFMCTIRVTKILEQGMPTVGNIPSKIVIQIPYKPNQCYQGQALGKCHLVVA